MTTQELETRKAKLREEWIKKPWKRPIILKQVQLLDKVYERNKLRSQIG